MSAHEGCHVESVERGPVDTRDLAEAESVWLSVSDMGCPNCARRVRNALLGVPGVLDAEVHLAAALATVAYDGDRATTAALIAAVESAGSDTRHDYRAELVPAS
jgi:copper chaperone CopZ